MHVGLLYVFHSELLMGYPQVFHSRVLLVPIVLSIFLSLKVYKVRRNRSKMLRQSEKKLRKQAKEMYKQI